MLRVFEPVCEQVSQTESTGEQGVEGSVALTAGLTCQQDSVVAHQTAA